MSEVIVIKTPDMETLKAFFENFDLRFVMEQHGAGPVHYACERNGKVLEIYPSKTDKMTIRSL